MLTDMYSEVQLITPELAKQYLERNLKNRPINDQRVTFYAKDMANGTWQLNSQGISFYENGSLADGQHRLRAVIRANTAVLMMVTYNVPNTSLIFDRGKMRTPKDILSLNDLPATVTNVTTVGAINILFCEAKGYYAKNAFPTDTQLRQFCEENLEMLNKSYSLCNSGMNSHIARKGSCIAGTFCALNNGISEERLKDFYKIVTSGFYNVKEETPAIVLRNFLVKNTVSGNAMKHKIFIQTVNAINDFMNYIPRQKTYYDNANLYYFNNVKENILKKYCKGEETK